MGIWLEGGIGRVIEENCNDGTRLEDPSMDRISRQVGNWARKIVATKRTGEG